MTSVSFLGLHTAQFDQMRHLHLEGYQLPVLYEAAGVLWLQLDNDAELHIYAQTDVWHAFFGTAPVAGLLVDDYDDVAARLEQKHVEWLSELQTGGGRQWRHYRALDGNVYELMGPITDV